MRNRWRKFWVRALVWLVAEIAFNLFGLDDLADASEFIFRHREPRFDREIAYIRVLPNTAVSRGRLRDFPRLP